jgi:hypothetical protein
VVGFALFGIFDAPKESKLAIVAAKSLCLHFGLKNSSALSACFCRARLTFFSSAFYCKCVAMLSFAISAAFAPVCSKHSSARARKRSRSFGSCSSGGIIFSSEFATAVLAALAAEFLLAREGDKFVIAYDARKRFWWPM